MYKRQLHINLSRDNDIIVVCPATANSIAKFANGYGDNLASNTLLASNKKILFVPAMNSFMWYNKINQKNVALLKDIGHEFIGPKVGNLKCGEFGLGRIDNSKNIVNKIFQRLENINLSRDNDIIVMCPATANSIAKFANGYGDNLASNTLLAANKKILFVPAMNSFMWHNKINQKNVRLLKDSGHELSLIHI